MFYSGVTLRMRIEFWSVGGAFDCLMMSFFFCGHEVALEIWLYMRLCLFGGLQVFWNFGAHRWCLRGSSASWNFAFVVCFLCYAVNRCRQTPTVRFWNRISAIFGFICLNFDEFILVPQKRQKSRPSHGRRVKIAVLGVLRKIRHDSTQQKPSKIWQNSSTTK